MPIHQLQTPSGLEHWGSASQFSLDNEFKPFAANSLICFNKPLACSSFLFPACAGEAWKSSATILHALELGVSLLLSPTSKTTFAGTDFVRNSLPKEHWQHQCSRKSEIISPITASPPNSNPWRRHRSRSWGLRSSDTPTSGFPGCGLVCLALVRW